MRGLIFLIFVAACSGDPDLTIPDQEVCLDGQNGSFCIWTYEAARKDADASSEGTDETEARSLEGRLPWVDISWEGARSVCRDKGLRLCERDEWIDACDGAVGADGTTYTYGDAIDEERCNVSGEGIKPGGSKGNCRSNFLVFDLSGNVWEWTGNTLAAATARGGGWRSSQTHRCDSGEMPRIADPTDETNEIGFRCCRDN